MQTLAPVRRIELTDIQDAQTRIAQTILRTPLVRLELGPDYPHIRLKLENLQPINAYKMRGAANAVAMLSPAERERGVWTISAGNAGQAVAYAAREAGVPCSVVVIETAPATKIERMRAPGARSKSTPSKGSTARWCIHSTITTSSPGTPPWGWRFWKTRPKQLL